MNLVVAVRHTFVATALLFLVTGCCANAKKSYDAAYCVEFKKSFLQECEKACLAKAPGASAACTKGCADALAKEPQYTKAGCKP